MAATEIVIPYAPRHLQMEIHRAMWKKRWGVAVCHRRFGKTVMGVNHLIHGATSLNRDRPRYAYIGPTYRQAKAIAWDYVQHYSRDIPGVQFNQSELRADYPNGGQVRLYGGDSPDSLRGIYLDGALIDEYGLHQADLFSSVLRPALADRLGWAFFEGTPNGRNQFYEIVQHAKAHPEDWYLGIHKASETGYVPQSELLAAKQVMTDDEYLQEFECSFEAAVRGAIFSREMEMARTDGRIRDVPYDPLLPVDTDWDLGFGGKGDATAIWFSQSLRSHEIRLIDYYEAEGEGLPHYAEILRQKRYHYGTHWAPHDIIVKESTGKTRIETAANLGIHFQIAPAVGLEEGIHAARMLFPRCYFDQTRTRHGLDALQHYRRDYNTRLQEFKATPVHDKASHGADAFRYLAVRHQPPEVKQQYDVWEQGMRAPSSNSWMGA